MSGSRGFTLMRTIQRDRARAVSSLKRRERFPVAEIHQETGYTRMIEPDRVSDLMGERVLQVVDIEIAVESGLPGCDRIGQMTISRSRCDRAFPGLGQRW